MASPEDRRVLTEETARYIRARQSLVEFRQIFLGTPGDVPCASFHHQWDEALLYGRKHVAFEAFRESAKTEYAIRSNLLHALTFPAANRSYILLLCATKTIASDRLKAISREFQASPEMLAGVDRIADDSGDALEVWYEGGHKVRITAHGKGSAVRGANWSGRRPDLIICDDLQDFEDMVSETVPAKDWTWFLDDVIFLGKSSRVFLIGNNLGENCIVEQVIRNRDNVDFDAHVIPIISEDTEQGVPTWPTRFTAEEILAEREKFARMGQLDVWYRNKMCRCISPDSQKFKREYFRYYEVPPKGLSVYITVDLAISLKAGADYSAIVTVGVNSEGQWFVLEVDYGRYDPSQTIDAIFRMVSKWRPLQVGVEAVAYQSALQHFLQKEMPRRNQFFRVTPLRAEKKKELRIDALQPRFAVGAVWFRAEAAWLEKIEAELLAYPHGGHDDVIDALAYVEQIAAEPLNSSAGKPIPTAGRM